MSLIHSLNLSFFLFLLGLWGIYLNRKNLILVLMSIELMLLGINMSLLSFSISLDDLIGQMFALLVLTVAAAESAIGLAILVVFYRSGHSINVDYINLLRR
uniref:NADH-ubiquinone oxidoreductase chain 4L n=1 Tax=Chloropicon sp. RCC4434 TaxID=2565277 RepID=A0A4D6C592_9CHLO|nr:NADH dehydrogenase subunit 4L [Chloropicon sp. RCC4434]